jgi:hypothetical protein
LYRLVIREKRIIERVAAIFPTSLILFTLMTEAIHSFEMSVLTSASRRHIPEVVILHSHRRENLKSYVIINKMVR